MSNFEFKETEIQGLMIIQLHIFSDIRGDYKKIYEENKYQTHGIVEQFTETSEIYSHKGVLRGIHYQTKYSQAKLLHVIKGKIFDVAVDLRKDSVTFGKWKSFVLSENDNVAIYIPQQFAHGFLALEDNTIFSYQSSGLYCPEYCGGILWNDKDLSIPWPQLDVDYILSEKDKNNISMKEYAKMI